MKMKKLCATLVFMLVLLVAVMPAAACENCLGPAAMHFDWTVIGVIIGISAIIGLIIVFVMKGAHRTAKPQRAACNYVKPGSFNLTTNRDLFLFRRITKVARPQSNSGGRRR